MATSAGTSVGPWPRWRPIVKRMPGATWDARTLMEPGDLVVFRRTGHTGRVAGVGRTLVRVTHLTGPWSGQTYGYTWFQVDRLQEIS